MYDKSFIDDLLKKSNITDTISFKTFIHKTFSEFCTSIDEKLSYTEKKALYGAITEARQEASAFKRKRLAETTHSYGRRVALVLLPWRKKTYPSFLVQG